MKKITCFLVGALFTFFGHSQTLISCNETPVDVNGQSTTITYSYPSGALAGCFNGLFLVTDNPVVSFEDGGVLNLTFSPAIQSLDLELIGISDSANDAFSLLVNGVDPSTDPNTNLSTSSALGSPVFDNSTVVQISHDTGIDISGNTITLAQSGSTYGEGGGTLTIENNTGITSLNLSYSNTGGFLESAATEIWLVDNLLSTNDIELSGISIYPNPANDQVNIQTNILLNNVKTTIFSVLGQKVHSSTHSSGNFSLNIAELNSGIYILQIDSNEGSLTRKLIKE